MRHPCLLPAAVLALLAACADQPTDPSPAGPPPPVAQRFACTAFVSELRVNCSAESSAPSGVSAAIIGGQGQYTQLTSSNVTFDEPTGTFSMDVTVQNLLPYAMGTADGVTPDPVGVRVFFQSGPAVTSGWGSVSVLNPDSVGMFTAANQPYFQYSGILGPGQTSAPRTWEFQVDPDVVFFSFTVLLATQTAATLVISEIMADPSTAGEAAGEWFEVHNRGSDPVNLQGWTIASGGDAAHTILNSLAVPAHGYVVLGGSADSTASGGAGVDYVYAGIDLANTTTDWLALRSPAGATADSVDWGAATGETAAPPPTGTSLELDSLDNNNLFLSGASSHWVPADATFGSGQGGTPGGRRLVALRAVSVAAGVWHTCAVDTGGLAWCWGRNHWWVLGTSNSYFNYMSTVPVRVAQPAGVLFTQVVAGATITCALSTAGQAYCWGLNVPNGTGQVIRSTPWPVPQPPGVTFVSLGGASTEGDPDAITACGLDAAGQAWCWGGGRFTATPLPVPGGTPLTQVAATMDFTCALSTAGQVYCRRVELEPGVDSLAAIPQPFGVSFQWMDVGAYESCGVSTIGQLFCWTNSLPVRVPVVHPPTLRFSRVAMGMNFYCALATTGQAYCRGDNNNGELGDGTTALRTTLTPVAQPPGVLFSALSLTREPPLNHSCALRQGNGQVYCWGANLDGQVGDGSITTARRVPVPVFR